MSNAGADLTIDCWLKIMSLFESFFLVFDSSTGVFDLLCPLKVEWLGILNPTTRCTLEGLVCRWNSNQSVLFERFTGLKLCIKPQSDSKEKIKRFMLNRQQITVVSVFSTYSPFSLHSDLLFFPPPPIIIILTRVKVWLTLWHSFHKESVTKNKNSK